MQRNSGAEEFFGRNDGHAVCGINGNAVCGVDRMTEQKREQKRELNHIEGNAAVPAYRDKIRNADPGKGKNENPGNGNGNRNLNLNGSTGYAGNNHSYSNSYGNGNNGGRGDVRVTNLKTPEFQKAISGTDTPTMVEFYAPWCIHCKEFVKTLEEYASEHPDLPVYRVDAGEETSLANRYQIMEIPTVILFRGGKQEARRSGALSIAELNELTGKGDPLAKN